MANAVRSPTCRANQPPNGAATAIRPQLIERMVVFTEAVFWTFLLLAGLSLFVLRWREPDVPRPYRVAGYPVTPALFCAACLFMVYASARYAWSQRTAAALWAIVLTALGVLASFVSVRRSDGTTGNQ